MELGIFILRIVLGLLFVGHGTQKLFGWFGGHGLEGTGSFLESLGYRPGKPHAAIAGLSEAGGGALIALGFLTPLGAAMIVGVMVNAIFAVHAPRIWVSENGMEYPLVAAAAALVPAFVGPGSWSVDAAIGWGLAGTGWGIVALLVGIVSAAGLLATTGGEAVQLEADEEEETAQAA